jgi:hypothetical protein
VTAPEAGAPRRGLPGWIKGLACCSLAGLVLAIAAAAGLVWLNSSITARRARAMEWTAAANLRSYAAAQEQYRLLEGAYADRVALLVEKPGPDGRPLNLLPFLIAAAARPEGAPYAGYRYAEMKTVAGRPVDWKNEFALSAYPQGSEEGASGKRSLIISTDGAVWSRECAEGAGPTDDFPADPAARGWRRFEEEGEW